MAGDAGQTTDNPALVWVSERGLGGVVCLPQPDPLTPRREQKKRRKDRRLFIFGLLSIVGIALALGLGLPHNPQLPPVYASISGVMGWAYFACWSISFWPQIYENWRRKSVMGFSFDFGIYNLLGFGCYAIFNCTFYFNERVQQAYEELHGGKPSSVALNDVVFAIHALTATLLALVQCVIYERGGQRVSEICKLVVAIVVLGAVVYGLFSAFHSTLCSCFTLLSWLYLLSYVKLAITVFKYMPQVHLNYSRKSTVGWSITSILLDSSGGLLSLGQVFGDAYVLKDWSAVTGNPVKFGLGLVSLVFDAIFMVQHYILYPEEEHEHEEAHLKAIPSTASLSADSDLKVKLLASHDSAV